MGKFINYKGNIEVLQKNVTELINCKFSELYDLKDEKKYIGKNSLEKMLAYKTANDGFDCDGTLGKNVCGLIRQIYRILWGWKDVDDNGILQRYAITYINTEQRFGPETINSFQTTYRKANKYEIDNLEKMILFANIVGRIGNMTLTYAGYNKYIAYDYWDIKINRQYLANEELSESDKRNYINCFFLWDYVNVLNNNYVEKEFWHGHNKKYNPEKKEIIPYIDKIDKYTRRRGLFMIAMVKIALMDNVENMNTFKSDNWQAWKVSSIYKKICQEVFLCNDTYSSYQEVFMKIKEKLSEEEYKQIETIVNETMSKINR